MFSLIKEIIVNFDFELINKFEDLLLDVEVTRFFIPVEETFQVSFNVFVRGCWKKMNQNNNFVSVDFFSWIIQDGKRIPRVVQVIST